MKILSFILVTLIFMMSLHPCSDEGNVYSEDTISVSDHEDEPAMDFCSPFCSCACCGASVAVFSLPTYNSKQDSFNNKMTPTYKENFFSEVSISFWQPPKV